LKKDQDLSGQGKKQLLDKQLEEEKILHAARLWQISFDSIPALVSIQDKDYRLLNINKAYEQTFNVTLDDLKGKKCYEIVHQSSCPVENCPNKKTLETKQVVKTEIFEPRLGAHFEVMTSPLFDEKGELFGSVHVAQDITFKKAIEGALRKSENSYRQLIETAPDALIVHRNNKIIYINPAAKMLFGASEEDEILGKEISDFVMPDYSPMFTVPNKDYTKAYETKIVRLDGFIRDCEISASQYEDSEGSAVQVILHDVTDRNRAETAHRESENLFQKIADNLPNSYLSIIERDMTVSFSAGQEFKKQNINPESFNGLSVEEIFADNGALVLREYGKTFDGEERSFELFVNNQYQLYRTVPLVSDDGSINRILAVVENITQRRLAEKKLQESEELFRTLTEAMPQIVWRADKNGIVDYYNEKAYEFHGISKGEIEKLSWKSIIHPDDYNETLEKWDEAIITGNVFSTEHRLHRADGEFRWHLTRGVPVNDLSGKIIRWIGTSTDIHEQKSHEEILEKRVKEQTEEIRKANNYNRSLLEASVDPLVTIEPDGKITDANKAAELIRGLKRNELIGTDFSSYFTEPEKARAAYLKAFSDGAIKDYPLTLKHSSGKTTDVLYNASVYKNESGEVEGVFAAARDVTDIKKAELNIRLNADRHNTMLSTMPDGFWVVDTAGKMIDVNDNYLKMSGYSREEFLKLSVPDVEVVESSEETKQHIQKIFPTGFDRFETKHRRKDGSIFDAEVSASYLKSTNHFISFIRDITEKKKAEERLEDERKRFNDVLEMLPAFVVLLTPDYYVRHSNRFFTDRFGDDKGKHCYEFLNNLTEPCDNCMTYKVLNNDKHLEWEWKGPDGRDYYIYDFPFRDVDGTDLILKMGIDITEMKRAEQQIIKLNEDLERRVHQRTAELLVANKELEAFSYSVSHDLRTPLSAIDGFSKILQRDLSNRLSDEYKEYLNRIISAADKMSGLITGLLNLSKISGVELKSSDVRLDLISNDIINRLKKSEPSRKVKVTVQPDIIVHADSEFITIVLENLINNAWKFTRYKKEAKIKIGTKKQNGEAIYFVKDNGIGFDMKNSEKLFTPFQRFHDCKKFEGSGIGLATVKRIIAKHGGRIWAESEMDKGTSFYFAIPG